MREARFESALRAFVIEIRPWLDSVRRWNASPACVRRYIYMQYIFMYAYIRYVVPPASRFRAAHSVRCGAYAFPTAIR